MGKTTTEPFDFPSSEEMTTSLGRSLLAKPGVTLRFAKCREVFRIHDVSRWEYLPVDDIGRGTFTHLLEGPENLALKILAYNVCALSAQTKTLEEQRALVKARFGDVHVDN